MTISCKVAIIISTKDIASLNIWKTLQENNWLNKTVEYFDENPVFTIKDVSNNVKIILSERDGIKSNHIEEQVESEFFIFASRHRAKSGVPALLIHSTGNWGEPRLGGTPHKLAYTSSFVIKKGLLKLQEMKSKYKLEKYKIDLEVTHHSPTDLSTPLCFMELGSKKQYWMDKKAALALGEAIIKTAKDYIKKCNFYGMKTCVGFGGNHYAYRFQKDMMENEDIYIGHIAPKYVLDNINKDLIEQAFEKTIEKPEIALIDKKGSKSVQREKIKKIIQDLNKEIIEV